MDNLIENVDEKNFTRQSHGLLTLRVKSDTDIIANLTFKSKMKENWTWPIKADIEETADLIIYLRLN